MSLRETINMSLHILVGFALAFAVAWNHWMMLLATFVYAWLREQAQHRWILRRDPIQLLDEPELFMVEKESFFGWVTLHRVWEVLQWTIGAAIACLIAELIW